MASACCLRADDAPNTNSPAHGTNSFSIPGSQGREATMAKLNSIQIPKVEYDHLPLAKVLNDLAVLTKSTDSGKAGVRFFINREGVVTPVLVFTQNLPSDPSATNADASKVIITTKAPLTDVRLADVLQAITKAADAPIKYSVMDYGVVFSLQNQVPPLEFRAFRVDPDVFGPRLGITFTAKAPYMTNSSAEFLAALRQFVATAGVYFDTNNPANAGKNISYSPRRKLLSIRATADELDKIGTAVESLKQQPGQGLETNRTPSKAP